MLLVEQNAYLALDVAHRAYVLNTGHITLEGTSELAYNPERTGGIFRHQTITMRAADLIRRLILKLILRKFS